MGTRIGLFGGTFDPVHNGHVSLVHSFLNSGLIDELWVLLTPSPPHKTDDEQTGYDLRLRMALAAFEELDQVSISTVEQELPSPSYTIRTLRHLKRAHPEHDFKLCIGEDSLVHFHQWKQYEEILNECDLLVAKRPGMSSTDLEEKILKASHFVEHEPIPISSTDLRKRISNGEAYADLIPDKVLKIIEKEHLYR